MLIIGASGFVGTHVRETAAARGFDAVAAGRRGTPEGPACDLLEPASVAACIEATSPDLVVNLAGAPSVIASWQRPGDSFAINATAALNLLEAIAAHAPGAHLTCLSSGAVYGQLAAAEMPLGEEAPVAPGSPYGAAKAAMEVLCGQYARSRGIEVAVIRAFNLLGPRQPAFQAASGFARQIAGAELDGAGSVELALGNPAAERDFTDVRDAAAALIEIAGRMLTGTFNLCSGEALSVADLVTGLGQATPLAVTCRAEPSLARPSDPPLLVGDPGRLHGATGWTPHTPIARSLVDLLGWWRGELAAV
jgi:GDP-4-dehydro-6-deoxy-D-mannose reductase